MIQPNTSKPGNPIPVDYAKTLGGTTKLVFPDFLETCRVVIGPAFGGKSTTFVRQRETAFMDGQNGAMFAPPGEGSMVFQCRSWPDVDRRWSRFIEDRRNGICPFKHIVLDPLMLHRSRYEEYLDAQYAAETMKMADGFAKTKRMGTDGKPKSFRLAMGQKYEEWLNNSLMSMLNASRDAGLAWTVIIHERVKEERSDPTNEYSPMIVTEGAAMGMNLFQKLCREADMFLDFTAITQGDATKAPESATGPKKSWQTEAMANFEVDRVTVTTVCNNRTKHLTNYDRGCRVRLPETIVLPRSCAIETLEQVYRDSCARDMEFWASKSSAKPNVGANNPGATAPAPQTGAKPQEYVP